MYGCESAPVRSSARRLVELVSTRAEHSVPPVTDGELPAPVTTLCAGGLRGLDALCRGEDRAPLGGR